MRIRAFAAADAPACADLLTVADGVIAAGWPAVDVPEFRRVTQAEEILVAELAGEVAGFLSFYRPRRFIHHLYVAPPSWRRGIGRALLAEALARLKGTARLKCRDGNLAARAFYRGLGWAERPGGGDEWGPWLWIEAPKANGRRE